MGFYEETYVGICALSFLSPTLYPHSHKSTAVTHAQCMCMCVGGIWPRLGAEKRVGACGNSSRNVRELKGMGVHPGQQMLRVTPQLDSYQLLLHPPPFYAEFHLVLHPSQSCLLAAKLTLAQKILGLVGVEVLGFNQHH